MIIAKTDIVNCSACGKKNIKQVLEMKKLSHVGVFCADKEEEKNYPTVDNMLMVCEDCGHGQLSYALDPNFLYNTGFQHCTSCSMSAKQANDWLFEFINKSSSKKFDIVAEIGINDSYCLKKFSTNASKVIGVDPILKGKEKEFVKDVPEKDKGKFIVIGDLIENVNFLDYLDKKPDLFMSNFVFEHIKDPVGVIRSILEQSEQETLIVIGVPGSEFLYGNSRFDQLSHQHYQQFTKHSLRLAVERAGGQIIKLETNFPNWGQLAVAFKKRTSKFEEFKTKKIFGYEQIKNSFNMFNVSLDSLKKRLQYINGKEVYGFGAAQNFPVFANFYNEKLPFDIILDDNPQRTDRFFPNFPYSIKKPEKDGSYKGKIGVMTGPDYARVLMKRMSQLEFDHIVVPFNSL